MVRYRATISLPGLRLCCGFGVPSQEYLLVSGGRAPARAWLKAAAEGRTLYCIDHGADACRDAGLAPSLFVGDGDSVGGDTMAWLKTLPAEMRLFPQDKDKTDTQLALALLADNHDVFVILSGGFGGRFDHLFSLLYAFVGSHVHGCIADGCEFLFPLRDGESVELDMDAVPASVSLLPLSPACTGVNLRGAHWPLRDAVLRQDDPYAVSNRLAPSERRISVSNGGGILAVYLCWDDAGK